MSFIQDKILLLKGQVQNYAWGGFDYIAEWLGVQNTEHKPFAEYWMGAHPSASSVVVTRNGDLSLYQLITEYPQEFLSKHARQHFNELPYLFKILDVKDMLSIQVHPTKQEAAKGYEKEEAAGVTLGSAQRNYKDKNHKPEVMVALSEFWLLHGFLTEEKMLAVLQSVPEFAGMDAIYKNGGNKELYKYVMNLMQQEVNEKLQGLVRRELDSKKAGEVTKEMPGWWVAKLYENGEEIDDIDRGVFSIYFFNIVKANEGEAVFQGAGIPHAYLEGQNVELMANSDNVLRGGLTPKHIDVPELLKHTSFEEVVPNIMDGNAVSEAERVFPCPVADFGISKIELASGKTFKGEASSLEIWVIIKGTINVTGASNNLDAHKGQAVAILPGEIFTVTASEEALIYKAFVPEP